MKITLNYFAKFVSKASILIIVVVFLNKNLASLALLLNTVIKIKGLTFKDVLNAMVVDSFSLQRPLLLLHIFLSDLPHLCTRAGTSVRQGSA